MIDIRLKVFKSVATNLSFTKASQELFISQPATSKHIQELEKEFGVRLFERMGNRIQLTKAGMRLLKHTNRILKDYQALTYDMNAEKQGMRGQLRIGASTTISQYVVPELIAGFRKRYPNVHITLMSGNTRDVETSLEADSIDIGMVEGIKVQPQLKYTSFMDDELVVIVRADNPVIKGDTMTIEELKATPIVLREFGSGTLDVLEQTLKKRHINLSDLNIEMNLGTTEGIKHYVEHSNCMGIVSIQSVSKEIYRNVFRIVDVDGLSITRQLMFVEKRGEGHRLAQDFKDFITRGYNR